jgi:ABC-type proline/glycine betaine transport system ATPase subunit
MILILYRIIANIQVILMGETGCGKTKLIKILNQLLNNVQQKLKISNIDPRYKDEDFIR